MRAMKRTEFNIEISAENVLESLGVTRQSELYEEMQEELSELLPGAFDHPSLWITPDSEYRWI